MESHLTWYERSQPDLPYIEALMKELFRWTTVAPIAAPHLAAEEDIYEGRFLGMIPHLIIINDM